MGAILITLNVVILTSLALLGWQWPPAFFAYLGFAFVGAFALGMTFMAIG